MGQAVVDAGSHEAEFVTYVIAGSHEAFREDALRLVQGIQWHRSVGSFRLCPVFGSPGYRRFSASIKVNMLIINLMAGNCSYCEELIDSFFPIFQYCNPHFFEIKSIYIYPNSRYTSKKTQLLAATFFVEI